MHVFYIFYLHLFSSAQFSVFDMERRSKNTISSSSSSSSSSSNRRSSSPPAQFLPKQVIVHAGFIEMSRLVCLQTPFSNRS